MTKQTKQAGFTLVELAIVLVIIGLIIGGVLVGQDLIKAAEIRTVVTDIEKFNAGATTFRNKYNGYPGDLLNTRATSFGLQAGAGTDGLGDADGILENGTTAGNKTWLGGENTLFWVHLSQAQLIPYGFTPQAGLNDGTAGTAGPPTNAALLEVLPITRIRDSADFHAYGWAGRNYFYLAAITGAAVTGDPTTAAGLSGLEAENIDGKMDDGIPTTGVVRARADVDVASNTTDANMANVGVAAATATDCVLRGAAAGIEGDETYIIDDQFGASIACQLRFRASF